MAHIISTFYYFYTILGIYQQNKGTVLNIVTVMTPNEVLHATLMNHNDKQVMVAVC